jgi:hypothetical protein
VSYRSLINETVAVCVHRQKRRRKRYRARKGPPGHKPRDPLDRVYRRQRKFLKELSNLPGCSQPVPPRFSRLLLLKALPNLLKVLRRPDDIQRIYDLGDYYHEKLRISKPSFRKVFLRWLYCGTYYPQPRGLGVGR